MKSLDILLPTEFADRNREKQRLASTFLLTEESIAPTVLNTGNEPMDISIDSDKNKDLIATVLDEIQNENQSMSISEEDSPLNNFRLIERKGAGSFGEVWKALNIKEYKIVALKFVNIRSDKIANAIKKEVQILEDLSKPQCHPFLSCYYSHFYDAPNKRYIIEMEYIDGEELQVWAQKFSPDALQHNLVLLAKDLVNALRFLKSKNIIHRDIKPGNILINKENEPKLVDFGISCLTQTCEIGWPCCKGASGTPYFMAPETIELGQSYFSSDVWSLGVTLFYLATQGQYPFDFNKNDPIYAVFNKIIKNKPKILSTPNSKLNTIVNGSIVKNPLERFTLEKLYEILEK